MSAVTSFLKSAAKSPAKTSDRLTVGPGADLVAQAERMAAAKHSIDHDTALYDVQKAEFTAAVMSWRDMMCEEQPSRHTPSVDIPLPGSGKVQVQFRTWSGSVPSEIGAELLAALGDVGRQMLTTKRTLAVKKSVLQDERALAGLVEKLQAVFTAEEFGGLFEYTEVTVPTDAADKLQFSLTKEQRQQLLQHGLRPTPALRVLDK